MTKLVVTLTLLAVAQYLISLGCFLEFFFSSLVTRIFIRMEFNGFLAICFFYFICRSAFAYAQHFVIISFRHFLFRLLIGFYSPTTTLAKRMTFSFKVYPFARQSMILPFASSSSTGKVVTASCRSVSKTSFLVRIS